MIRRWLVTGARGFVGRSLVARLTAAGAEVIGIGRTPAPGVRAVPLGDLSGLRRVIAEFGPAYVVHLAGATHMAPYEELLQSNVFGTAALLDALSVSDARLVLASSAAVYGQARQLPIDESHPCSPVTLYGASKLIAEKLVRERRPDAIVARLFNVVGPGQPADHVCGRVAAQLAARQPVVKVGPLSGTRDFIDVRDVATALQLVAERASSGAVINVASGQETAIHEAVKMLFRAAKATALLVARPDVPPGVSRSVADISRLRVLGFSPKYSLEQSLQDLFIATCSDTNSSRAAGIRV